MMVVTAIEMTTATTPQMMATVLSGLDGNVVGGVDSTDTGAANDIYNVMYLLWSDTK